MPGNGSHFSACPLWERGWWGEGRDPELAQMLNRVLALRPGQNKQALNDEQDSD